MMNTRSTQRDSSSIPPTSPVGGSGTIGSFTDDDSTAVLPHTVDNSDGVLLSTVTATSTPQIPFPGFLHQPRGHPRKQDLSSAFLMQQTQIQDLVTHFGNLRHASDNSRSVINGLSTQINDMISENQEIKSSTTDLQTSILHVKDDLTGVHASINSLQNDVAVVTSTVSNLTSSVQDLRSHLIAMQSSMTTIASSIERLLPNHHGVSITHQLQAPLSPHAASSVVSSSHTSVPPQTPTHGVSSSIHSSPTSVVDPNILAFATTFAQNLQFPSERKDRSLPKIKKDWGPIFHGSKDDFDDWFDTICTLLSVPPWDDLYDTDSSQPVIATTDDQLNKLLFAQLQHVMGKSVKSNYLDRTDLRGNGAALLYDMKTSYSHPRTERRHTELMLCFSGQDSHQQESESVSTFAIRFHRIVREMNLIIPGSVSQSKAKERFVECLHSSFHDFKNQYEYGSIRSEWNTLPWHEIVLKVAAIENTLKSKQKPVGYRNGATGNPGSRLSPDEYATHISTLKNLSHQVKHFNAKNAKIFSKNIRTNVSGI